MSLQAPITISAVFAENDIKTPFVMTLMQCTELALAVNLQRKYAVWLETTPYGIFCETWLAAHNAQHASHVCFDCFYSKPKTATTEICAINGHLTALLHESTGGAA